MHSENRTWRYGLAARIVLGAVAVFMFGVAAFLISIPLTFGAGDQTGDWIIGVTALVTVGFALFVTFGLVAVLRTRISLDGASLDAMLPNGHNLLLVPRFRTIRLPVTEIRSVERREEISKSFGLSTLRESLSVVTTEGERIGLFSNTNGALITLPLGVIADAIASAAGISVTDDGTVMTKAQGLYGAASSTWTERPLDPASAVKARQVAMRTLQILVGLMTLGFVLRACLR
jgi:hypothetical protein